jgi:hypothetical protein
VLLVSVLAHTGNFLHFVEHKKKAYKKLKKYYLGFVELTLSFPEHQMVLNFDIF